MWIQLWNNSHILIETIQQMNNYPPVIIIGMSRSGTSLLTRMLESLGLFVGKHKDKNNEAIFFVKLNKWFLDQCSAGLENPSPIKYLIKDKEAREIYVDYVCGMMKAPNVISYLGLRNYLVYGSTDNLDFPWGWKDPRNTYTLPIWLDVFPGAKVIHIYRNPLDVINSLRVRRNRGLSKLKVKQGWLRTFYWYYIMHKYVPKKPLVEMRCSTLEEGLIMWDEYMTEAGKHLYNLEGKFLEVKYESLLLDPIRVLNEISEYCELKTTGKDLKRVAEMANTDRAFAYLKESDMKLFASNPDVAEVLKKYGY